MRLAACLLTVLVVTLFTRAAGAQFDWPANQWTELKAGAFVQAVISDAAPVQQYRLQLDDDPGVLAVSYLRSSFLARLMREVSVRNHGGGGSDGLLDTTTFVQVHSAHEIASYRFAIMQPYLHTGGAYTVGIATYHLADLPALSYGETLSGSLTQAMPVQVYRFSGRAGDTIRLVGADSSLKSSVVPLPAYSLYQASYGPASLGEHAYALRIDGDYALVLWAEGETADYRIVPTLTHEIDDVAWYFLRLTEADPGAEINAAIQERQTACLRVSELTPSVAGHFRVTAYEGPDAVLQAQVDVGSGPTTFTLPGYDGSLRLVIAADQFGSSVMAPPGTAEEILGEYGLSEQPPANELLVSLGACERVQEGAY